MKKIALILTALTLCGCAGLDVTYQLQANYISKELAAKRQAEADKAREQERIDVFMRGAAK